MQYLSAEDILVLHALVIDETGGSHGVREVSLLRSIAHKPQTTFDGGELYPTVWIKASVLLEAIVNYHVFIDGNKRTSLVATARFLAVNGYEFTASNESAEKVVLQVATKAMTTDTLALWLEKNTRQR